MERATSKDHFESVTPSFIYSFIYSFIHSFFLSFFHSFIPSFKYFAACHAWWKSNNSAFYQVGTQNLARKATGNPPVTFHFPRKNSEPCLWFPLRSKSSMRRSFLIAWQEPSLGKIQQRRRKRRKLIQLTIFSR